MLELWKFSGLDPVLGKAIAHSETLLCGCARRHFLTQSFNQRVACDLHTPRPRREARQLFWQIFCLKGALDARSVLSACMDLSSFEGWPVWGKPPGSPKAVSHRGLAGTWHKVSRGRRPSRNRAATQGLSRPNIIEEA